MQSFIYAVRTDLRITPARESQDGVEEILQRMIAVRAAHGSTVDPQERNTLRDWYDVGC